jgi:hypothetical protein
MAPEMVHRKENTAGGVQPAILTGDRRTAAAGTFAGEDEPGRHAGAAAADADLQLARHVGETRQVQLVRDGHRLGRAVAVLGQNQVRLTAAGIIALEGIGSV